MCPRKGTWGLWPHLLINGPLRAHFKGRAKGPGVFKLIYKYTLGGHAPNPSRGHGPLTMKGLKAPTAHGGKAPIPPYYADDLLQCTAVLSMLIAVPMTDTDTECCMNTVPTASGSCLGAMERDMSTGS